MILKYVFGASKINYGPQLRNIYCLQTTWRIAYFSVLGQNNGEIESTCMQFPIELGGFCG